ncbi:hypothetical protein C2845_PM01G26800 [Panicum miliaceum]|uniref:Uncharacterized protein n=1 Tax=Panicum miliaceum TaxID=4540 RepID=A0A3L6TK30_PANMI|nr:hypothetical protein C2845_PM01G26800 [Panicum miliaceum]
MEYVPRLPLQRPERAPMVVVASKAAEREAARLCDHAVLISADPNGYKPSVLEVAYGLSQQLRIPRHNIRVSRHRPEDFLAEFDFAPQQDRAVGAGQLTIGGSSLLIRPWRPVSHGPSRPWYFNAKISIEAMPQELWSEKGGFG